MAIPRGPALFYPVPDRSRYGRIYWVCPESIVSAQKGWGAEGRVGFQSDPVRRGPSAFADASGRFQGFPSGSARYQSIRDPGEYRDYFIPLLAMTILYLGLPLQVGIYGARLAADGNEVTFGTEV